MASKQIATGLSPQQQAFLDKRQGLIRLWRYVGPVLLLLIFGFTAYLLARTPLLINPFEAISRIEAGNLPESTLVIMAAMLPIMFGGALILLLAIVLVMYAAISNEKKYAAIIAELGASRD